jgi:hypothetical protein
MDPTTFETWLSGFASLTDLQRRSAWQALALLSEAAASPEAEALAASERAAAHAKPPATQVQAASLPALRLEARVLQSVQQRVVDRVEEVDPLDGLCLNLARLRA